MKKIIIIYLATTILLSCKTTDEPVYTEENGNTTEEIILDEPVVIEEVEEPVATVKEGIEVSEDLYNKTFSEINELIKQLTQLIRRKNYNGWKKHLSNDYILTIGSAEYLDEISNSPSLKDIVKLKNLRDYFEWVVVPSRINAKLDEIVFKDEQHVTAYMYIEDLRTILFQFELIEGKWTITYW